MLAGINPCWRNRLTFLRITVRRSAANGTCSGISSRSLQHIAPACAPALGKPGRAASGDGSHSAARCAPHPLSAEQRTPWRTPGCAAARLPGGRSGQYVTLNEPITFTATATRSPPEVDTAAFPVSRRAAAAGGVGDPPPAPPPLRQPLGGGAATKSAGAAPRWGRAPGGAEGG